MRVPCTILRSFPFSVDGFTSEHAEAGSVVSIPSDLIEGLARAGYLRRADEAKAMGHAAENKMIETAPENKDDLSSLRAAYQSKFGKRPFMGWDADELTKRMNGDG